MDLSNETLEKIGRVVRSNINDALEQVVFPKFDELSGRMDKLETKIENVEERLGKRIDKLAEVVTDVKTNHERRLRTLEDEVGVESSPIPM